MSSFELKVEVCLQKRSKVHGDIHDDIRDASKQDFAKRGNLIPSGSDLLGAYMQLQLRRTPITPRMTR
ncbi:MAG: hypothetical protein H7293_07070 [Candidatus Saccharibacteria bacterium]|nr:hypothetical protein [Rhodoferax sp.]